MQINLKQREIEAALKMYLHGQGINLKDKRITIDFTAGRKDSGLSAEISIIDQEDQPEERRRPVDTVVETGPAPLGAEPDPAEPQQDASPGVRPVSLFN